MKKVVAIILSFILLLPSVASFAQTDSEIGDKKFFLDCLGITRGIEKSSQDTVTRAEFTAMVVRTIAQDTMNAEQGGFSDVTKENLFINEIYAAKALRIANGTSDTTFSPNDTIIYEAACKELVIALGYEYKAEYLGSYPIGYFKLASELNLGMGVSANSGELTFGDAVTMIYNALHTPVMMHTGMYGDEIIYDTMGTPLEVCFKLNCVDGIVSTVGFISDTDLYKGRDVLEISGKVFKCTLDAEAFFGKNVSAWYDDKKNVVAIDAKEINNEIIINVEDIEGFTNNELSVFDEEDGKEKKYRFDPGFSFVKNGGIILHKESDFITSSGEARLIDNNQDNLYDYYILDAKEYFVVRSLNSLEKEIYDKDSSLQSVNLYEDNERSVKILKYDVNTDTYTGASFDDIKEGTAVEVYQSNDKSVCKIILSDYTELTGVIAEIGDDKITVGDKIYELNYYFKEKNIVLKAGTSYSFILAPDNTITDIKSLKDEDVVYGITLGYNKGVGLSANTQIKLMTVDNTYEIYNLAKRVVVDGVIRNNDDSSIESLFKNGSYPRYMLIRYQLNGNEEISVIDTPNFDTVSDELSYDYDKNNSLTCYSDRTWVRYNAGATSAMPNYVFNNTLIFTVPSELSTNENRLYDDELFRVVSLGALRNDTEYKMSAYDLDETYSPAVVMFYTNDSSPDAFITPHKTDRPMMVSKITDAAGPDGENVKKIYVVSAGKYYEYYIYPSLETQLKNDNKWPDVGDIVRLSLNGTKVTGLARDVSCTSSGIIINYNVDGVDRDSRTDLSYIGGSVLAKNSNTIVFSSDQKPSHSTGNYVNNIAPIRLTSPAYTVFDMKSGEVYPGKADNLKVCSESEQYVVCRLYSYRGNDVYIYIK